MDAGVVTGRAAPGELGVAAGDGDGAAALDLGDLPGDLSDGAGGGGDHYRLAFAGGAGVEQREIGGEARHAVPAQRALDRRLIRIEAARALGAEDGVFLPAEGAAPDSRAGGERRGGRTGETHTRTNGREGT